MAPRIAGLPGVSAFPITPPSLGQRFRERPINYVIVTSDSYENLSEVVRKFQDEMANYPGFLQVDTDLRLNKPEVRMDVDRERAADMGVSVTLPLSRVVLSPTVTRPFFAVPRTSVARTASG